MAGTFSRKHSELFGTQFAQQVAHARHIAARLGDPRDQTKLDGSSLTPKMTGIIKLTARLAPLNM
jgi:hypothetical protein